MPDPQEQIFPNDKENNDSVIQPVISYTRRMLSFPHASPIQIIGLARALHAILHLPQITKGVDVKYSIGFRLGTADDYDTSSYVFHVTESRITFGTTYQARDKDLDDEQQIVFNMEAGGTIDHLDDDDWINIVAWVEGVQSVFDNNAPADLILTVQDKSAADCVEDASDAPGSNNPHSAEITQTEAEKIARLAVASELINCTVYDEMPSGYSVYWVPSKPENCWYSICSPNVQMTNGPATLLCICKKTGKILFSTKVSAG